jgi:hypothetical protein
MSGYSLAVNRTRYPTIIEEIGACLGATIVNNAWDTEEAGNGSQGDDVTFPGFQHSRKKLSDEMEM